MKQWLPLSAFALAVALLAIRPGFSQDEKPAKPQKPATAKEAGEKTDPKTTARKPARRRLPNYYGKIGISDEQRQKIYAVQETYEPQIEALKKQMAALVAKQNMEIEQVLTETQREQLAKAREEAKQQARERGRKAAAEKAAKEAAAAITSGTATDK